ncbi:MAG: LacI family transcriptional regulator, partial [Hyphomicrobiales bacterium]
PGRIALFEGSIGLSYRDHQERDTGFNDVLRELFPDLEVAVRRPTHDSHEEAYKATLELLEDDAGIQGIYNVGGGLRGNVQALKERGRSHDMVCIGHELTSLNRQFLIDGILDAVIDQSPALQTMEAARLLYEFHAQGGQVSPPRAPDVKIYLRENMP